MALPKVPQGEQRARFLAVGLADETVRIISLDTNDCLTPLSTQALPARPESLCIVDMGAQDDSSGTNTTTMFLNIGMSNQSSLFRSRDWLSANQGPPPPTTFHNIGAC